MVINGIVLFIYRLTVVYRNGIDFICVGLIYCDLAELIISYCSLIYSLKFYIENVISSAKR